MFLLFSHGKTISEQKLFSDEANTIGKYIKEIESEECFLVSIVFSNNCKTTPILYETIGFVVLVQQTLFM
jgi:hypothetical protein